MPSPLAFPRLCAQAPRASRPGTRALGQAGRTALGARGGAPPRRPPRLRRSSPCPARSRCSPPAPARGRRAGWCWGSRQGEKRAREPREAALPAQAHQQGSAGGRRHEPARRWDAGPGSLSGSRHLHSPGGRASRTTAGRPAVVIRSNCTSEFNTVETDKNAATLHAGRRWQRDGE